MSEDSEMKDLILIDLTDLLLERLKEEKKNYYEKLINLIII